MLLLTLPGGDDREKGIELVKEVREINKHRQIPFHYQPVRRDQVGRGDKTGHQIFEVQAGQGQLGRRPGVLFVDEGV